jgi:shikimate dehydrogenase
MYPHYDECPVSDTVIKRCENVFDAIYNPVETVLIKKARAFQKKAVGGMSMLIWQAVAAHQIWDNAEYELAVIQHIIKDMEEKVERDFR